MTPTIRICNWSDFQHYKGRNPPWIKLHRKLLHKREWRALSDFARGLLPELWMLASESDDGSIGGDTDDLCWKLRYPVSRLLDLAAALEELQKRGFIRLANHDASTLLAECKQPASTPADAPVGDGAVTPQTPDSASTALAPRKQPASAEVEAEGERESEKDSVSLRSTAANERSEGDTIAANEILAKWIDRQSHPPPADVKAKQGAVAKRLAKSKTREQMIRAWIGIEQLFPHSAGQPWDLFDLERKFANAMEACVNHPELRKESRRRELLKSLEGVA